MMEQLDNLFRQPYNRQAWLQTLRLLVPLRLFAQPLAIDHPATAAFYRLGSVTLADQKQLGIYDVKTNPHTQLHRNRVQMRNLAARQCQQNSEDGALAVYYDDENHWRFSFISMEYQTDDQGAVSKKESAAKRYTYLLGQGAKVRIAVSRFSQLQPNATLHDLKTAFAVQQLNREFYQKLFKWYEKAKHQVVFPNDEGEDKDNHIPISLIRLLTRLLFIWFIKEKGLVNPDFFELDKLRQLIHFDQGSSYYKAILQNLFFATLNQEIQKRSFRTKSNNYLITNIYRYQNLFLKPDEKYILSLFQQTPFLNGGLFDCLDRDATAAEHQPDDQNKTQRRERSAIRVDGFSDRDDNPLRVPNELFFSRDDHDPGLIDLLQQYPFTVEESTPLDADVALDPELLGLVFENLLAAYNPETRHTARKQTGSYYTPREIVGYMVDESLKAYLAQAVSPYDRDADAYRQRLDALFVAASETGEPIRTNDSSLLYPQEVPELINAIERVKILDPAVGSGAFPMGALHRLVSLLSLIDPDNAMWKQKQIDTVQSLDDPESRAMALQDIETIFSQANRYNDFGRKLYLIENAIYGVDVQPIAVQIAKLRFFISLTIEQTRTNNASDNYGIKPLPNLETKFVAADSLMGLNKPEQMALSDVDIASYENELKTLRLNYFTAKTLPTKRKYKERDKELRNKIAALLVEKGWNDKEAGKIALWDPYDQNARTDWFDAEYMFGVKDGFDVVIGNPPYVQLQKDRSRLGQLYKDAGYETFTRTGDLYQLFYERGVNLLRQNAGYVCFISSNQWMRVDSGKVLRKFIESQNPIRLVNLGAGVFDNVTVNTGILMVNRSSNHNVLQSADLRQATQQFPPTEWTHIRPVNGQTWIVLSHIGRVIKAKMEAVGTPLKDWDVSINRGITTGYNTAFMIDTETKERLVAADPHSAEIIKPVLRGRDIQRFQAKWAGLWLIYTRKGVAIENYPAVYHHLLQHRDSLSRKSGANKWYELQASPSNQLDAKFSKEKIVWGNLCNQAKFSMAQRDMLVNAPCPFLTPFSHYLLAMLNSKLLDWYFRMIGVERDGGYYEYKPMFIERLPIPNVPAAEQRPFLRLVDHILTAKAADPKADTSEQEAEIDRLVSALYGLTTDEIAAVENV